MLLKLTTGFPQMTASNNGNNGERWTRSNKRTSKIQLRKMAKKWGTEKLTNEALSK